VDGKRTTLLVLLVLLRSAAERPPPVRPSLNMLMGIVGMVKGWGLWNNYG